MRLTGFSELADGGRLLLDGLRLFHDVYEARERRREEARRVQDGERIAKLERKVRKLRRRKRR